MKKKVAKIVWVHLKSQSEPIEITGVQNTYQKGSLFCVFLVDNKTVYRFPIRSIFRVTEIGE